jgi:DNA-binding transcriptional regulator GbsR (MarR family)
MPIYFAMKLVIHFERIKKMNRLIQSGQTGTPAEFAEALGISQSHLFRCLHVLEQYGMDIRYSRSMKTYFYGNDNELSIYYSLKLIADSKTKEILGGKGFLAKYYTELHREAQSFTENIKIC